MRERDREVLGAVLRGEVTRADPHLADPHLGDLITGWPPVQPGHYVLDEDRRLVMDADGAIVVGYLRFWWSRPAGGPVEVTVDVHTLVAAGLLRVEQDWSLTIDAAPEVLLVVTDTASWMLQAAAREASEQRQQAHRQPDAGGGA